MVLLDKDAALGPRRRTGCHHARCWGFLHRRIALDLRDAGLIYSDLSQALLCLGIMR